MAVALLAAFAGGVRADVVFEKPPSPSGGVNLSSWVYPEGSDSDIYAYDDFTIPFDAAVTEIRWRGGYSFGAPYGHVNNFTVTFFESAVMGSEPHVGNPQLEDTIPTYLVKHLVGGNAGETAVGVFGGVTMYDYAFTLPTPFMATGGVKYWVRIEASQPVYPDWGVTTGTGGDTSHFQFSTGSAMFSFRTNDLSFKLLTTGPVPTLTPTATPGGPTVTPTATALPPTPTPTATALPPTPSPTPTATTVPDHFTCYVAGPSKGAAKFANRTGVGLIDALGTSTVTVKPPKYLCAPTDKLGEDPTAPAHTEHLEGYQIKPDAKFVVRPDVAVVDQLNAGGLIVDVKKPAFLLVPAVKAPNGPTPPLPSDFATDEFQCYVTAAAKNAAKFVSVPAVSLHDQFGTMTVDVQKPKLLCAPVDRDHGDPAAPVHPAWLACYQVKQTDKLKFTKQTNLFVNQSFGPETLDAKKPALVCGPATVTP
jgi:hypothetical protein